MEIKNIIFIVISIIFAIYTIFCILFDGSYIQYGKGIGWQYRIDYPISFTLSVISTSMVSIGLIVYTIITSKKVKNKLKNKLGEKPENPIKL